MTTTLFTHIYRIKAANLVCVLYIESEDFDCVADCWKKNFLFAGVFR